MNGREANRVFTIDPRPISHIDVGRMSAPNTRTHPAWLLPMLTLWQREVVRFYRQRNRIIGALATPLVFWFLVGSGLGPSFRLPDGPQSASYLEYFFPGTLVLIMLFTAIFSTISVIEDRREGFLQSVLVAPIAPGSIVTSKLLGGTTIAVLQGFLFLILAPFAGLHIDLNILARCLLAFVVVAFGLTGLGFLVAWPMESTQGFHAIMNVFLMPLWLMSGALFPVGPQSGWVYWVVMANPVTYGVAATRRALYSSDPGVVSLPSFEASLIVSAAFGVAMYLIGSWMVNKRLKS